MPQTQLDCVEWHGNVTRISLNDCVHSPKFSVLVQDFLAVLPSDTDLTTVRGVSSLRATMRAQLLLRPEEITVAQRQAGLGFARVLFLMAMLGIGMVRHSAHIHIGTV